MKRCEQPGLRSGSRPKLVTWLGVGVLIFAAFYITRLAAGLYLPDLPYRVPRWYIPLTGGVWGACGILTAAGLWNGFKWGVRLARLGSVAFTVWYWADRLLLARTDYTKRTWPFALAISVLALAILHWSLRR